jgi:hypothetical protein
VSPLDLGCRADRHALGDVGVGYREGHATTDVAGSEFRSVDCSAAVFLGRGDKCTAFGLSEQGDWQLADAKDYGGKVDASLQKVAVAELRDFQADALGKMPDVVDLNSGVRERHASEQDGLRARPSEIPGNG